jgi:cytochrome c oxidase assembly protein subunit 11
MSEAGRSTGRIVRKLALVVVGMFGFGYLMVPIYDVLCDVTGLNGKTGVVDASEVRGIDVDRSREITVEFVANLNRAASLEFKPEVVRMKVHPGKMYSTTYFARNTSNYNVVGQAVPSVAPREAAKFFNKTECFCFSNQLFAANESKHMPLTFVIDPDIPRTVKTVTLSYTFFDTGRQAGS